MNMKMLKTLLFVLWYRKHACPMYGHRQRHDGEDEQWYTECRNQRPGLCQEAELGRHQSAHE